MPAFFFSPFLPETQDLLTGRTSPLIPLSLCNQNAGSGKNHTFVELLSRAGRCTLVTEADGVILIQDGR